MFWKGEMLFYFLQVLSKMTRPQECPTGTKFKVINILEYLNAELQSLTENHSSFLKFTLELYTRGNCLSLNEFGVAGGHFSAGGGQGLGLSTTGKKGKRQKCVGMQWSSWFVVVIVVQSPSCVWLCNPMDHSMPGFPAPHHIPEFAQVLVHGISDAIQLSHPLSPSSPSPFNLSQHQGLC